MSWVLWQLSHFTRAPSDEPTLHQALSKEVEATQDYVASLLRSSWDIATATSTDEEMRTSLATVRTRLSASSKAFDRSKTHVELPSTDGRVLNGDMKVLDDRLSVDWKRGLVLQGSVDDMTLHLEDENGLFDTITIDLEESHRRIGRILDCRSILRKVPASEDLTRFQEACLVWGTRSADKFEAADDNLSRQAALYPSTSGARHESVSGTVQTSVDASPAIGNTQSQGIESTERRQAELNEFGGVSVITEPGFEIVED